jgi:hypothetical protein
MQWKLTISEELAMQTISKATANKETVNFREFVTGINAAFMK